MPNFLYRAMDASGQIVPGNIDAINALDLELRLSRMELDLIDYRQARQRVQVAGALGRRTVTLRDLINFCFHMEQMASAGVPLLEALNDLRDNMDHLRFREIITDMIESIEGGMQLSAALAAHPDVFDLTFTSLVRAGEASGKVNEVFRDLSDSLKWQDELAAQTRKIVTYPSVVLVVVTAVTFFLMIYLVPQLTAFIGNMGRELPLHTKALIVVSNVFIGYWYLLIGLPVAAWFAIRWRIERSERTAYAFDRFKLHAWVVGPVLHKIILARFATFFAMMYASGITILECIRLSEGIVGNRVVAQALRRAARLISDGHSVTAAFATTGLFPQLVIRMLKVGEATGALDGALRNVAYFYNREVREQVERVQAMIEPAMTLVLGLLLGWIMLSVLGPIYDTISAIRI
ncbi:type II secretion system F family protein [Pseudoduganella buxea]|uniref:Type II secretion system F family protein n=1 Tax=Pseudoduganella buxea TaxID=1949069 RepID=A0A6I3SYR0_9BURK|nr:type II secretion system F family protein [Pseudoduganella buxea]MTV54400.1 type II secretion system F family protein [Pseudoduganella buxea]GGC10924.1 type II secretion system protein [Pseudoduganella buxea]